MFPYEYIYPNTEKLATKPLNSSKILNELHKNKIKALVVTVDNRTGSVIIYCEKELSENEKRSLDVAVGEIFKKL